MTSTFSPAILAQHIAFLGKTGSGKTTTAKLMIEQVVANGARVCVLDTLKSDWWGLTSSADGRRAGLPFHILGGPHGHVPLHSSAGKAVAEIVANGSLPLSIIDMADFEPGGQQRFFTDFAPTLLRRMRGVVYLVIEEAHIIAPKERSGMGSENLSIHWAKTMATAGRSKGIRLALATQRTQALHNALLGSCDTLIAHRLTAPADQEPVVKWLKANTSRAILEQVSTSLASLTTGQGWICAGEAKQFERVAFPRIATYDNTATPTDDAERREVMTAPVNLERLRAIIREAMEQVEHPTPKSPKKGAATPAQVPNHSTPEDVVNETEARQLREENASLRSRLAALEAASSNDKVTVSAPPSGRRVNGDAGSTPAGATDHEALYQMVKERLSAEAPKLLRVLLTKQELAVEVERKTVTVDGSSLKGRIAYLIGSGFFDDVKRHGEVRKELDRTGAQVHGGNLSRELATLRNDGFLYDMGEAGYIVADGAKINVHRK